LLLGPDRTRWVTGRRGPGGVLGDERRGGHRARVPRANLRNLPATGSAGRNRGHQDRSCAGQKDRRDAGAGRSQGGADRVRQRCASRSMSSGWSRTLPNPQRRSSLLCRDSAMRLDRWAAAQGVVISRNPIVPSRHHTLVFPHSVWIRCASSVASHADLVVLACDGKRTMVGAPCGAAGR